MLHCQPTWPSAFSQYLATNFSKDADYVVHDPNSEVIAAKWHRPASRSTTQAMLAQHTLMYHVGGSTSVAKLVGGRCIGTGAQHGSVTSARETSAMNGSAGGVCEILHVYISPSLIERYADEHCSAAAAPEIDPMFAAGIPGCRAILPCCRASSRSLVAAQAPDGLLLTQSMES